MSYRPHVAGPVPRRRHGRLRPLTLADRRRKAERNARRGRDQARRPRRGPGVWRIPAGDVEVSAQKILAKLLGR